MPGKPVKRKILRKMQYISDQQGIMNRYYADLSLLKPGSSCLITNVREIIINSKKQVQQEKELVHIDLPGGK